MTTAKNAPKPFMVDAQGLEDLLSATIPAKFPVMITGMPGGGKTTIVKYVSHKIGAHFICSHPVVKTPTDYAGFPWMVDGKAKFIPYSDLECIIEGNTNGLTVFLIDDMGQASKSVQAALMQIVCERSINGHNVSDDVVFIACTNRKEDKAAVSGIIEPLKSRFHTIVEYQPDQERWSEWAFANGIDPSVVAFIRLRPQFLTDFHPSSDMTNSAVGRTIEHLSDLVKLNLPPTCRYAAYVGAVGEGCASEWKGFEDIKNRLPNLQHILEGKFVDTVSEPSVCYALIGALIGRVNRSNIQNVYDYFKCLRFEFQALWHKDVKAVKPELVETSAYTDWSAKHGKNLS